MPSTSGTTGTLSSLGLGSGLDANSIVTKLVALERQPIDSLQKQADKIQTKISAFGQIQSAMSTVRDAAKKLANPEIWASTVATSSDSTSVSFSTSAGAATGNYSVTVGSLAASQSVVTKTPLAASTSTLGSGSLSIEIGTWSGTTFAAKAGTSAKTVTIAATDTLEAIRDKINDAAGGATAAIIKDASGARLVMSSSSTGAANGFRIQATDTGDASNTDDAGLSSLAYDLDPLNPTLGTEKKQDAKDAAATINGVDVTSSTNKFSDVLSGITFTVGKLASTAISVSVTQDNDGISKAIGDLATGYSALSSLLKTNTKYDEGTKSGGVLQGDGTALALLNQFRSAVSGSSGASSVFATLSSIGVELQTSGDLKVNSTKLSNALGKLSEVKKLFSNADSANSENNGIGTRLRTLGDNLLSFDGALSSRTAGLRTSVTKNQKDQDKLNARVDLYEARLRKQYTALDKTMAGISAQGSYVNQTITNWNKG